MHRDVIRVLLVDDHALIRSLLRQLLERAEDIDVVGETGDAEEALALAGSCDPRVILLDVGRPGRSGLDIARELLRATPNAYLLVLSMLADRHTVAEAFAFGAHGYLLKDAAVSELVDAVRAVSAGKRYLHPSLGDPDSWLPAPPDE